MLINLRSNWKLKILPFSAGELGFYSRRTILNWMCLWEKLSSKDVQNGAQNHPHTSSICPVPGLKRNPLCLVAWLLGKSLWILTYEVYQTEVLLLSNILVRPNWQHIVCPTRNLLWPHTSHEVTSNTHGDFQLFPYHQDFPSWNEKFNTIRFCFNLCCFWIITSHLLKFHWQNCWDTWE